MARDWKARNTDRVKAYRAKHYKENKERARETHRSWMARHPGKKKVYQAAYTSKHKEKISLKRKNAEYKARRNKRARERYLHDYPYRIQLLLRSTLTQALRLQRAKKKVSAPKLLGCSVAELMRHLETQFKPGMSWENYGDWEIDHRRPCCSFDLAFRREQEICFHFMNLQPLWKLENRLKSGTWNEDSIDL